MNTKRNTIITVIFGVSIIFASVAKIAPKSADLLNKSVTKSNVNLTVESNVDIYGVQFDIKYNPSELNLSESGIVSKVPGVNIYSRVKEDGVARVLIFGMTGEKVLDVNSDRIGDLIDINFDPAEGFKGTSKVELEDVILAGKAGEEVSVSTAAFDVSFITPQKTALSKNYPNPFNPSTKINYQLSSPGFVNLVVYDLKGAEIRKLVNQHQEADYYEIMWDGLNGSGQAVASGRYIMKMTAPGFSDTITMTLLK